MRHLLKKALLPIALATFLLPLASCGGEPEQLPPIEIDLPTQELPTAGTKTATPPAVQALPTLPPISGAPLPTATPTAVPEPTPTAGPSPTPQPSPAPAIPPTPAPPATTPPTAESPPESPSPQNADPERVRAMVSASFNRIRASHGKAAARPNHTDRTAQQIADTAAENGWASHWDQGGIDPHLQDILSPGPVLPESTLILVHPRIPSGQEIVWPDGIPLGQAHWGGIHRNRSSDFWARGGPIGNWWSVSVGYAAGQGRNAYTVIRIFNERAVLEINTHEHGPSWFSVSGNVKDAGANPRLAMTVARRNAPTRHLTDAERRDAFGYDYGEVAWIAQGKGSSAPHLAWNTACPSPLSPAFPRQGPGHQGPEPARTSCVLGPALLQNGVLHPVQWHTEPAPSAGAPGALGIQLEVAAVGRDPSPGLYTVIIEYSDDENPEPEVVSALPVLIDVLNPRVYRSHRNDSQVEVQWDAPVTLPSGEPHLWEVQWTRSWENRPQTHNDQVTWHSHEPGEIATRTITGLRRTWDYHVRVRGKTRASYAMGWSEWLHVPRIDATAISDGPVVASPAALPWDGYAAAKDAIMATINAARRTRGLPELQRMSDGASQGHAADMAVLCYLSPWHSDGTKPHTRQALSGNYHWTDQLIYGHGWCPDATLAPEGRPENPTDELTLAITRRVNAGLPNNRSDYVDLVAPAAKPHAPRLRSATGKRNGALISWNQTTGPPATHWQYLATEIGQEPDPHGWSGIPDQAARDLTHRINDLNAATKYAFRVRAVNTAGVGNSSNAVTALVPDQQRRDIRLKARMYGDGRLAIKWHDPVFDPDDELRYQYRYRPVLEELGGGAFSPWQAAHLSEDDELVIQHGLHPDFDYEVEMRATASVKTRTPVHQVRLTAPNGQSTQWHRISLNGAERDALARRAVHLSNLNNPDINPYEIRITRPDGSPTNWTNVNLNRSEHRRFQSNRRGPGEYEATVQTTRTGNHQVKIRFPDGNTSSNKTLRIEAGNQTEFIPGRLMPLEIRPVNEPNRREIQSTLISIEKAKQGKFEVRFQTVDEQLTAWTDIVLDAQEAELLNISRHTAKTYQAEISTQLDGTATVKLIFPDGQLSNTKRIHLDHSVARLVRTDRKIRMDLRKSELQPYRIRLMVAGDQRSSLKTIYLNADEAAVVSQLPEAGAAESLQERAAYGAHGVSTTIRRSNVARVRAGTPAKPIGLQAKSSEAGVTLHWHNPADYRITGWEYRHRAMDQEWSNWQLSEDLSHTVTIPGLKRGTKHLFQVRALWNDRASPPSSTTAILHPAAPALPPRLDLTPLAGAPLIRWTPGGAETISSWEFQVQPAGGVPSAWTPIPGNSAARSHLIEGYWLDTQPRTWQPGLPNRQYDIRVRAVAGGLGGPSSETVEYHSPGPRTDANQGLNRISNTEHRQWQQTLFNPAATHAAIGIAQNAVGQTWMTIDVASRRMVLTRAPEIVDGQLIVEGSVNDGRSVFAPEDIQVEIHWDLGPWPLTPSQLARTAGYDWGQPSGIILPSLVAYRDVDFVALPIPTDQNHVNPCAKQSQAEVCVAYQQPLSPYEAVRDEPPRSTTEAAELKADAWSEYLRDNRLVPVYRTRATKWQTQGRSFRIEANVRDMLEEYRDGTYTVVIALREPQNSQWSIAAAYPTFHGQEPTVPNQWGTGYRPDRTVEELATASAQLAPGQSRNDPTRNYQINAIRGWNTLRLSQPQLAELIANQPWLRDWISLEEKRSAEALVRIAQTEADQLGQSLLLERLLDDRMLSNGIDPYDTTALRSIWAVAFKQNEYSAVQEILNREGFREGLSENDVKSITVLPSVTQGAHNGNPASAAILEWYRTGIYQGQRKRPFDFQERVIRTPLANEVTIALFRTQPGSVQLMDTLADSVRTVERIMDVAMPVSYIAVMVHDDASDQFEKHPAIGQHYATHFTVHPDYDRAHWGGHDNAGLQVSSLIARYYWIHQEAEDLNLIRDGANELVSYLAEQERRNRSLWPAHPPCAWASNITELPEPSNRITERDLQICRYAIMSRMFLELMETTGTAETLARLRRLSARLNQPEDASNRNARHEMERMFPETHNISVIHKWWEGRTKLGRGPLEQAHSNVAILPNAYGYLYLYAMPGCVADEDNRPPGAPPRASNYDNSATDQFDPRVCVEVEYRRRAASAQPIEVTMVFHYEDGHRYREQTRVMHYATDAADAQAETWQVELPEAAAGNHWVQLRIKGETVATAAFYNPGPVDPNPDEASGQPGP